ncbi:MAG: hypothetical protein R6X33_17890 [Candidatus Brocadiia bacterium]
MPALLKYTGRALIAVVVLTAVTYLSILPLARFEELAHLPLTGGGMLLRTFLDRCCVVAAMAYPAVRSRWSGTQLMFAVGTVHFGIYTLVPRFEAGLVLSQVVDLPTTALLTAHGFLLAMVFSFVLVCAMGRLGEKATVRESARLHMSAGQWLWRLALCLGARLLLKAAGLVTRRHLAGAALGMPQAHQSWGWLLMQAGQAGQALLLIVFSLPVVKMMRGGRLEATLSVTAVIFAVGSLGPMISAQPFLPGALSLEGAIELGATNLLYGALVGYLFSRNGEERRAGGRGAGAIS